MQQKISDSRTPRPALPSATAGDNLFYSFAAAQDFKIPLTSNDLTPNITREHLRAGIAINANQDSSYTIANDGVLFFLRPIRDESPQKNKVIIFVPGLGVIGDCYIDKGSGEIINARYNIKPEAASALISKSPSSIAAELQEKLSSTGTNTGKLSEITESVVEVFENEGVIVNEKGLAIIFGVDRKKPEAGCKIRALRSKVLAIQTRGMDPCHSFLGGGSNFGFLFHATDPTTFDALAATIEKHLPIVNYNPNRAMLRIVRNNQLFFEFGDLKDKTLFERSAEVFATKNFPGTRVMIYNSSACSMLVSTLQINPREIDHLPTR